MEDVIGRIDPKTGTVEALVDLSKLREHVTQACGFRCIKWYRLQ
ncbi:Uncharacterised protein [Sphingobacterium multivorum]|uniref:Uncharacterized protein n=1 Tax=Sphingobacterium multivorum TaxID=28454 RepID=A0A2X2IY80_SPHMU|nr:Uncharacterised protein [Sphingobacterium multivorum]